ncbi:MAG TPA: cyclic nucleotide-binding domain-containing protein [Pyrinomonadaceae bacterium]|nr:cyclic nucleotide-binding domain-containing protein [Pyrinomonadaceae bacterium]
MLNEHQANPEGFFGNAFLADDLFYGSSPETLDSLLAVKQTKQFAENELIFSSGQMPCCIYFLIKGEAQIIYNAVFVRPVKRAEILGLTEAITDLPYEITVKAVSPCRFECIGREDFIRFLQNEPGTCFRLLQMLGANLQKVYQLFANQ